MQELHVRCHLSAEAFALQMDFSRHSKHINTNCLLMLGTQCYFEQVYMRTQAQAITCFAAI